MGSSSVAAASILLWCSRSVDAARLLLWCSSSVIFDGRRGRLGRLRNIFCPNKFPFATFDGARVLGVFDVQDGPIRWICRTRQAFALIALCVVNKVVSGSIIGKSNTCGFHGTKIQELVVWVGFAVGFPLIVKLLPLIADCVAIKHNESIIAGHPFKFGELSALGGAI